MLVIAGPDAHGEGAELASGVRSSNANRKEHSSERSRLIVKRGERGYRTHAALFGQRMSQLFGSCGLWSQQNPESANEEKEAS